tara:strand:+ start:231 stop:893 length:663 start_codon:yes stop_codon:yes gene_type:complete
MRFPLGIIFVLLFAASLWQSSNQLVQARELSREEATAPFLGEYKNSVIDLVMFGHRRLYDDLVYLWLIQYIVEDKVVASDYHKDFERIKNIVRLGPKIETVYPLSCFVLAYDYKKPQDCHFITVRGLEFFPSSWVIPMTQGYLSGFQLNDPLRASFYYHMASKLPHSPPYVAKLAEKFAKKEYSEQDRQQVIQVMRKFPGSESFMKLWDREYKEGQSALP